MMRHHIYISWQRDLKYNEHHLRSFLIQVVFQHVKIYKKQIADYCFFFAAARPRRCAVRLL